MRLWDVLDRARLADRLRRCRELDTVVGERATCCAERRQRLTIAACSY